MNEEPLSVVDEDDADYSSPASLEATSQRRGISHQRDEDCITQKCKVSRLQATASDWHRHLDYGLDPGFPNLLMSETCTPACIVIKKLPQIFVSQFFIDVVSPTR